MRIRQYCNNIIIQHAYCEPFNFIFPTLIIWQAIEIAMIHTSSNISSNNQQKFKVCRYFTAIED